MGFTFWDGFWLNNPNPVYIPSMLQAHHKTVENTGRVSRVTFAGSAGEGSLRSHWMIPGTTTMTSLQAPSASPGGPLMELSYFCSPAIQVESQLLIILLSSTAGLLVLIHFIESGVAAEAVLFPVRLPSQVRHIVGTH